MRNGRGIRFRRSIWRNSKNGKVTDKKLKIRKLPFATLGYFCMRARKTRSSTGTARVKSVGGAALETPTA